MPGRGAFKFRGACNAVQSLSEEQRRCGVVTHSSGNHALSLALAAQLAGIPAYIVVPSNTPQVLRCGGHCIQRHGQHLPSNIALNWGCLERWCAYSDAVDSCIQVLQRDLR